MNDKVFNKLLLLARPAAGKSEIIAYLSNLPLNERISKYHIGKLEVIDDFPMLWTWFEEDSILEQMGYNRLFTDQKGYFLYEYLWDLLIEKIDLENHKLQSNHTDKSDGITTIIEFSRGKEHGGFRRAFSHLKPEILKDSAILYVNVSWNESLRKNRSRFNPDRPDSILQHSLPDEKLMKLYYETDWEEIISSNPEFIKINDHQIPYIIFENEDDVTTPQAEALGQRLRERLSILWEIYHRSVNQVDIS